MLQSLSLSAFPAPEETIDSRVILDINPEEKHGLAAVFEAMDNGNAVAIRYPEIDGDSVRRSDAVIEPYCMRFRTTAGISSAGTPRRGSLRSIRSATCFR